MERVRIYMPPAKVLKPLAKEVYGPPDRKESRSGPIVSLDDMPPRKRMEMLELYGKGPSFRGSVRHDQAEAELNSILTEVYWPGQRVLEAIEDELTEDANGFVVYPPAA